MEKTSQDTGKTNPTQEASPKRAVRLATPRRIDALDGLRALAILGVVAYHAWPASVPGGFLGVTMFFVLSGYLITRSTLRKVRRDQFSYGSYLHKRLARLWPALAATVGVSVLCTWVMMPNLLPKLHTDAVPAVLFASNWFYIFHKVPYFANAGLPSPVTQLWYTSLIMQFYLVWPPVLLLLRRVFRSSRQMLVALVMLALVSTTCMSLLYSPEDVTHAYYGLETRFAELMAGAIVAYLPLQRPRRVEGSQRPVIAARPGASIDLACFLALLVLAAAFFWADGSMPLLYHGGFLAYALVMALLVWRLVRWRSGAVASFLSLRPLTYLGERSFSLFLWHYPLLILMNPANRTTALPWWGWVLELAVIWVATELSWRLFEAGDDHAPKHVKALRAIVVAMAVVAILGVTFAPVDWDAMDAARTSSGSASPDQTAQANSAKAGSAGQDSTSCAPEAEKVPSNLDASGWTYDAANGTCDADVLVIGDSITDGAVSAIQKVLPNAYVDAKVSRQLYTAQDVYAQDVAAGHDASVVIVALGSNSLIRDKSQVQTVIDAVGGRPLYFVTIRCPYPLQDVNNKILRDFAAQNDNVGIIDWNGASAGHDDWLVEDGTHLTADGQVAYAALMRRALAGK